MADKLIVDGEEYDHRIVWLLEDGDLGMILGGDVTTSCEMRKMLKDDPFSKHNKESENTEHVLYTQEALKLKGIDIDENGFVFSSVSEAVKVLKTIKAQAKARIEGRPLPKWAITALANGWKPSKGWKP